MQQYQSLIFIGLMFVVMYFFMIRPQQKKIKDHKKLVDDLQIGDKVVTTAGIHGKIVGTNDKTFLLEMESGAKIRFDKSAVSVDATKALSAPAKEVKA